MDVPKVIANGITAVAVDTTVFKSSISDAGMNAAAVVGATVIADMVSNSSLSSSTGNYTDLANLLITGAAYAGIDNFTDKATFSSIPGKMFYAMGVAAIGDKFVKSLVQNVNY